MKTNFIEYTMGSAGLLVEQETSHLCNNISNYKTSSFSYLKSQTSLALVRDNITSLSPSGPQLSFTITLW